MNIKIQDQFVGNDFPTYFIADIAANHDGNLARAKKLITLAKRAGADAAKFQHFKASKIVSDYGFKNMPAQSHQAKWKKSVYEVYKDAEINRKWDNELFNHCKKEKIHFFSSPYDFEAVDELEKLVPAYKIGSGDINWDEILIKIAQKNKPVILATGASDLVEVMHAVQIIYQKNKKLVLMQCNTNYTADDTNFQYINLRVLETYKLLFPDAILGLSDHTRGNATVLGAVTLGARVIEKHFTDDNSRVGPDHGFAMNPQTWTQMVKATRELESALGSNIKKIEDNETDTVIVQRRCVRAAKDIKINQKIKRDDLEVLRPASINALKPNELDKIIGKCAKNNIAFGEELTWEKIC